MSRRHRSISRNLPRGFLFAIFGALCAAQTASAEEVEANPVVAAIQQQITSVFEKCRSAVVKIQATDRHGRLSGTGFFVDPNGTIFTTYTVGGESQDIVVLFGDKRYPATRLIGDVRSGIAMLKIAAETPFLTCGKSHDLAVASPVITIGYPMDLPLTPAFGTVGGFDIKYMGRYFHTTHIRANISVQRGEGGAPLLNLKGEVMGILISRVDAGSASFVLPIEAAEKVRLDFLRFHEMRPGWIGVNVKESPDTVDGSNVLIDEVTPDSPGAKAGLLPGDILLQVGDHKISSPEDIFDAVFYTTAEDDLRLRVARNGQEMEFQARPIAPPDTSHPRMPSIEPIAGPTPALKIGGN
jgi:S1-C subfamily serine protease